MPSSGPHIIHIDMDLNLFDNNMTRFFIVSYSHAHYQ